MVDTIPADADVLEVGCGPGGMWRSNLARVPRSWRILLTDLTPGMTSIVMHQGHNTLRITETEAVVQYVLSFNEAREVIVGRRLDDLRRRVRDEIGSDGTFAVQTHTGLFIARKASLPFRWLGVANAGCRGGIDRPPRFGATQWARSVLSICHDHAATL